MPVHVFERLDQASDEKLCMDHWNLTSSTLNMVPEISSLHQVHHQVQIELVLKRIVRLDDERAINHFHELELIQSLFYLKVFKVLCLGDDFHCKEFEYLVLSLGLNAPYLTSSTRFHVAYHAEIGKLDFPPFFPFFVLSKCIATSSSSHTLLVIF